MRKIFFIIVLLTSIDIYSQQYDVKNIEGTMLSNINSPNATSFERYEMSPMNYYNGSSSINIPIYEINIGNLKYPISINYSLGGIQVNQISSDIGLGWSMNTAQITRSIIGDADLESIPSYQDGCRYSPPLSEPRKMGFLDKMEERVVASYHSSNLDYFPDIFNFFSPSYNTKFFFKNKNNAVDLEQKGTKIEWILEAKKYKYLSFKNYRGDIEYINDDACIRDYKFFKVTTNDRIEYFFDKKDLLHSYTASSQDVRLGKGYPRISAWHISKIKDNATGEEIIFDYESYTKETTNDIHEIYDNNSHIPFYAKSVKNMIGNNCYVNSDIYSNGIYGSIHKGRHFTRYLELHRLKKITFRGGSLTFLYEKDRQDFINTNSLTKIIIHDFNGKEIKNFRLEQGYFNSIVQKNEQSKRLKLMSIIDSKMGKYRFEYFEENSLPNIGSNLQDFFGYCNQQETNNIQDIYEFPIYYYYPNKFEYSILPYKIENKKHYPLGGSLNKLPNDLSKTWSLKTVRFPTGGYRTYTLESNEFNLWGTKVKGGGTRVKEQKLFDNDDKYQNGIKYYYDDNNSSSGVLLTVPYVGFPASKLFNSQTINNELVPINFTGLNNIEDYFYIYSDSKINYDINNNFFIGYDKIIEDKDGAKTIYEYPSSKYPNIDSRTDVTTQGVSYFSNACISNFLITNSSKGSEISHQKGYLRTSPTKISHYDTNGNLINKNTYEYNGLNIKFDRDYHNYPEYPIFYGAQISSKKNASGDSNSSSYEELISFSKSYNPTYNKLVKTSTISYFPNGNNVEEKKYLLDEKQRITGEYIRSYNNPSQVNFRKFLYSDSHLNIIKLNRINKINNPILVTSNIGTVDFNNLSESNTIKLSESKVQYDTSSSLLPNSLIQKDIQSNFSFTEITYDHYDDKGNLLQYTPKSGISTTTIYGYKKTLPIAKIEGAKYSDIANLQVVKDIISASDNDKDEDSEKILISKLEALRNNSIFSTYQITTYTHDPLIGVTSITPPSGITEFYKYDSANRLERIVDTNGNILKEYKYNLTPTKYYNSENKRIFRRNNCGSNAVGEEYTYTVPANKYFSIISQEDADQKAINDINTNGQREANIVGKCTGLSCGFSSSIPNANGKLSVLYDNYIIDVKIKYHHSNEWYSGIKVGSIAGNCGVPSKDYSSYNGRIFFTIKTNGDVIIRLPTGSILNTNITQNYILSYPIGY
ncbi:MAG: DUF5977 domain-containing protein [Cruoricaptor ignavus]|nr:DUF5977 domain-containing protein [Cruoricaptor ignavus]